MPAYELFRYGDTLLIRKKVSVMLLVALFVFMGLHFNHDELEDERIHKEGKSMLLAESLKAYGVECSPTRKSCFQIFDAIEEEDLPRYINSAARLLVPEKFTRENSNFSTWPVDKAFVPDSYFQTLIVAPFGTEALSDKIRTKQRVLVLGLGGGTIPNFLSLSLKFGLDIETTVVELDPFMAELAAKYFDFREANGRTDLIVADGIAALKQAAENKTKYNAVLLDACYSSDATGAGLLCPVSAFYKPEAIGHLYEVLEDGGTLAVNTVFNKNESGWEQSTMQMFKKSFPSCDFLPIESSKMFVCTKKSNWSVNDTGDRFIQKRRRVKALFGFPLR